MIINWLPIRLVTANAQCNILSSDLLFQVKYQNKLTLVQLNNSNVHYNYPVAVFSASSKRLPNVS